ncbi:PREDICTED: pentatricopeptide [Prunus dulcis]|uniref:PREDICTED: pentatricopeptide n=1 Tax=Prunus dulcis TaxID=3755 RepID=A0A5E4E4Q9_PRUDU|nr:pentatricopeptide repeat-containing protein At3g24000, mitochondrial-like isoform X1 [Prunus dulcis]XP_034226411.1 pentatricopeptide repeat-containing protein At3g24000, mitochondrial-like isoform X1 [Prunus dulcis]XP_034226412.1 pentatricopeptide repeat-containing protein At3g24000, mitochondrial-like isoform X1 [Prunus dulcis]XP_034226413.1 pentatricopeptide repeat-containing protein At3g24000, mitochondrial-like isoform X1 [Prunus dulcis]VVA10392.1 PREDICTED: pentatricopeptide [Prunus dul
MECDLKALRMSPAFRSLLLPICQRPTSSVQLHNKLSLSSRSLLLSVKLKPLSCAALEAFDLNPISDLALSNVPNSETQLHEVRVNNGSSTNEEMVGSNVKTRPRVFNSKKRLIRYSGMLRTCVLQGSLNEGKVIHGQVIKNGIDPDLHLWVSLVNVYAKCGDCGYARKVLDEMPEQDVVSWTTLIQGFVVKGFGVDAVKLFCEMKKDGTRANEFALATGLKACSLCFDLGFGKQLHAEAVKLGFFSDVFVGSALVSLYAKCGEMELADTVLFCMPEQNVVSWNALLNGYAQEGDGKQVLKLFCRMTESEMRLSKFTLSTVLKGCANSENLRGGQFLHSLAIKSGCKIDEFLGCSLVDMYSKCGMAIDAVKVFRRIKNPDVVAWSAIITCLDQQGQCQEVAELFREMISTGISPNQFSLSSIISAATDLKDLHFGESVHAFAWKYGCESDISVSNALITMYMKIGRVLDGAQVFEAMTDRDLISWNSLLSGTHNHEICDLGPRIFHQMLVEGFKPNMYSFISVLRSCSSLLDVGLGKQVHAHIVKTSLDDNDFVGTALIDMYAKIRFLEDAVIAFNKLSNRDLFIWTVIITGYAQSDQAEKAVACFSQMQQEGVKPNEFALAGCLSACSCIAMLENGRQLHSMAIKSGHLGDLFVSSALVDMYAKCGCIGDAEDIFGDLDSRDTVSWNIMICGYSQYGRGEKAIEAFSTMLNEGAIPDEVTFIGILSACSHLGLVEEGKKHFDSLIKVFRITPTIEHYACMVDILVRAGKFNEAESFIETMNLTLYPIIWETVLGACKMYGNVEFGETAAKKLFELKPEMDSTYILLSNIFAVKGRWDDVSKVRKLMSSQGVKKKPGCSWVEVDGQVNTFVSQDGSHPRIRDIHLKLEELGEKLNSVGYIPETEDVLHNITEREKNEHLQYHSERLALAFSLISTNPPKTIRIFKNLRICGDCHEVMKLISDVTNREIVVRDVKRFHHFKSGTCSCNDFW